MTNKHRFLRRGMRLAAFSIILAPLILCLYSCATQGSIRKRIATLETHPITGIIKGTEAQTLKPTIQTNGSSTAILLIHGYLSSNQDFGELPQLLADRGLTVRLMRLPGHGTTPLDLAGQKDGAFYRAVQAEYEQLAQKYDHVRVGGFSLGGALSTILASEKPIDRLALVAPYYKVTYKPYYILPPEAWQRCLGWAVPIIKRPPGFVKINNKEAAKNYFMYHALPSSSIRQLMAVGKKARQPETLSQINCPVLMIHSPGDEAACPKAAEKAFQTIGSEDKKRIWLDEEKSNHVILWDYEKEKVLKEMLEFLSVE